MECGGLAAAFSAKAKTIGLADMALRALR